MMHWQWEYVWNLSEVQIYEVTLNENITFKERLPPPIMHSHNMVAATLVRTAESLHCSGKIERWPQIWSAGVDSSRILLFFLDPELKVREKTDPDLESLVIFGSSKNWYGLCTCDFWSENIA